MKKNHLPLRSIFFWSNPSFAVSALKNKSEMNLEAAKLLNERYLCAPSIHCAYYSVLQLMKFAVYESMGISYEKQDQEINALKTQKATAKGTHEYLIMKVEDEIRRVDYPNYTDFTRNVKVLKRFRTKSDYDDEDVFFEQSTKAFGLANELRTQLKRTFKV
jgi:hypothetical protein